MKTGILGEKLKNFLKRDCLTINKSRNNVRVTVHIGVRARRLGGCSPQTRAKSLFFGQKLNFSGRSQQAKWKWNIFLVFI